jgi:ABC-type nickel/cobalt efflux system permease component RcnA
MAELASSAALPSLAAASGVLHVLIPDHWLPFVLIGRARGLSARRVGCLSLLSALIHAGVSVGLGLAALGLGAGAAERLGRTLTGVSPALLVGFGLLYAAWAWHKGGHFHPGGRHVHAAGGACAGDEGPGHPEHLHYHADQDLIRDGAGWSGLSLAAIVGLNPCVIVLPLIVAAAPGGAGSVAQVILAYALPTTLLMVGLSVLGVRLGVAIRLPAAARHAEAASGLLIAAVGLLFGLLE